MALNKFYNSGFTKKIIFGKSGSHIRNPNTGVEESVFKPLTGAFYCMPYTRTMHQNFELTGTKLENTRQVGVRHQWVGAKLTDEMKFAVLDGKLYKIVDNNPDESGNPNGVDILSLKESAELSLPKEMMK